MPAPVTSSSLWNKTKIAGALVFGGICFLAGRFFPPTPPPLASLQTPGDTLHPIATANASAIPPARETPGGFALDSPAWNEKQWRDLVSQPATSSRNAALAKLLEVLAATNPAQALALAQAEGNRVFRDQLVLAVLHGWARLAPTDAAKWALAWPNPREREAALTAVFTGAVAANPEEAVRTAKSLIAQNPGEAVSYGGHLIDALCDAGHFDVAAKMAAGGDDNQRSFWLGSAYSKWATLQPEQAAQAAAALADPTMRNLALHGVVGGWVEADPASVIQFVTQLPPADDKSSMISQALHRWTRVDLKAASDWINHNEMGAAMDEGISSVATQDYIKPDVAVSWAESVINPTLRSQTLVAVLRNWATVDLPAMKHYFETSQQLLPDDRQEIAGVIATLGGQSPSP